MSRSSFVFIVVDGGVPLTAFTVRYELGIWYRAKAHQYPGATYCRVRDGGSLSGPVWLDPHVIVRY